MLRWMLLKGSESDWLKRQATDLSLARRAVRRFMPGEELDAAMDACATFHDRGIPNILTFLGENVRDPEAAYAMGAQYLEALDEIGSRGLDVEISVKLTQFGLDLARDLCRENMTRVVQAASDRGNFVWIDMEGSPYTDVTLEEFTWLRRGHGNVGVCLQAYLYRTRQDLEALLPLSPAIRLVKGAYAERREIAFPKKADVDENFLALASVLLCQRARDGRTRPAFATHDTRLIDRLIQEAGSQGLSPSDYEFQLLYGIQPQETDRLAEGGYDPRVLVSYGDAWFPWFMRRLAERPGNVWFVARNVFS